MANIASCVSFSIGKCISDNGSCPRTRSPGQPENFFCTQPKCTYTAVDGLLSLAALLFLYNGKKLHFNVVASFDLHNKTFAYCCRVEANKIGNNSSNNSGSCVGGWRGCCCCYFIRSVLFLFRHDFYTVWFGLVHAGGRCLCLLPSLSTSAKSFARMSRLCVCLCYCCQLFSLFMVEIAVQPENGIHNNSLRATMLPHVLYVCESAMLVGECAACRVCVRVCAML